MIVRWHRFGQIPKSSGPDLHEVFTNSDDSGAVVLLVASTGGHLAQLVGLEAWWQTHEREWVTFDKADARSRLSEEVVHYAFHPTTRNIRNALRNLGLAWKLVQPDRYGVVVSSGAGVALPFFVVARLRSIPTVYLEVYDRVSSRTLTGRLCRHLSTTFCVQWPQQLELYPGATLVGPLL